jgi:hypothetical protein
LTDYEALNKINPKILQTNIAVVVLKINGFELRKNSPVQIYISFFFKQIKIYVFLKQFVVYKESKQQDVLVETDLSLVSTRSIQYLFKFNLAK